MVSCLKIAIYDLTDEHFQMELELLGGSQQKMIKSSELFTFTETNKEAGTCHNLNIFGLSGKTQWLSGLYCAEAFAALLNCAGRWDDGINCNCRFLSLSFEEVKCETRRRAAFCSFLSRESCFLFLSGSITFSPDV